MALIYNQHWSDSSDNEAAKPENTVSNIMYKLADLSFTHSYDEEISEKVDITNFIPWYLSVKKGEGAIWNVFYKDKILILKIKAFSGQVKRSKHLLRQK